MPAPIKSAQPFPAPELRAEILWTVRFFQVFLINKKFQNKLFYARTLPEWNPQCSFVYALSQCFWLRGTKLRPWSEQNSDPSSGHCISSGIKRDKLKGTNGAKFAVFRRLSLIFADFRFSWKLQHVGSPDFTENRRFSQKRAENCRNPFVPFSLSLLIFRPSIRQGTEKLKSWSKPRPLDR